MQLLALFLQVLLCVVGFLVVAFALWEWGVLVELCLWEKKGKSGTGRGATHALVFVGVVHEGCDAAAFDDVHGDVFVELGEGRG